MPDTSDIIDRLNALLKGKLTAINQYFLHARMLKYAGEMKLADYEYKASIDAMKHADMLVEQVLRCGGAPNLQELGKLAIGADMPAMMRGDLALAETVLGDIRAGLAACEAQKDSATAAMLGRILENQLEHVEFLRGQTGCSTSSLKDCA